MRNYFTNLWQRIEFWILWLIIGILADEYIKEGYFFKVIDLVTLELTHEKIIAAIISAFFIFKIIKRRQEKK